MIKILIIPSADEDIKQFDPSHMLVEKQKAILENSLEATYKDKLHLTLDPGIPLLGNFLGEMKTHVHTKTCRLFL